MLLRDLSMSDDNYSSAWKILMDEYKNKRLLIQSHLESFVCFSAMKSENIIVLKALKNLENMHRIKKMHEFLTVYIRGLFYTMKTSDASLEKMHIKFRSSVNNVSVINCINCTQSHNLAICEAFFSKSIAHAMRC